MNRYLCATKFQNAWPLSRITFSWMDWMVLKSKFKGIDERDLSFDLQDSCQVIRSKFFCHWKEALRPSLVWTLLRCFYWDFVLAGVFKFMWSVLICLCAFYFVEELTTFVANPEIPDWYGWALCVGFLIGCVLLSICYQQVCIFVCNTGKNT